MKTTIRGWRRHASLFGLALAGLLGAPQVMAHDTQQPIAATEGGSGVVAVSAGSYHSCGLKTDGSVDCWGANGYDRGQAVDQAGPYLSVSAGSLYSCGLKADGSVDCWGANGFDFGQAADQPGPYLSVSAGYLHSCGVKTDGSVDCWGANGYDRGQAVDQAGPYLSVSAGYLHSCGVKADGSVDCWGGSSFDFGQAADQTGPYLSVSAGVYHSCGLKADGSVDCWGDNSFGQAADQAGPYLSVSTGYYHSCGVKVDGSVDCWGDNGYGQGADQAGPYVSVSASQYHSCGAKADGGVVCWGAGGPGTSGGFNHGQSTVPAEMSAAGSAAFGQIAAGNAHACQLKLDGTLSCWGDNTNGQIDAPIGTFTQVVAGNTRSCAIGTDSKVSCWGQDGVDTTSLFGGFTWRQLAPSLGSGLCGIPVNNSVAAICRFPGIGSASWLGGASGFNFRNITNQDGRVCGVSWLATFHGDGYCNDNGLTPIPGPFQRLEAGLDHQCGLKAAGSLQCWGSNADGQTENVPLGTFRAFSVGWNHACAIKGDGTLSCWGSNLSGQTDAPAGTYVQVAAGNTFTCAIRGDGQRVCWGASPGNPARLGDLPDGTLNVAYSQQITISGPNAPANPVFVQMSGTLPPGLSLSASGLLSGTPTTAGTFTFTIDAEGSGDFAATRTYAITIADSTPPAIDYTLTGGPMGSNGWYVGDVTVTWSVVDPDSAITSKTGCEDTTLSTDTAPAGVTYSCTATSAGGTSGPVTVTLKRDAAAPTVTVTPSPAANANGWHKADVGLLVDCADPTPGSGLDGSCQTLPNVTAEGGTVIPAQQATDNAGNIGTSTALTVKVDKTAPTLAPTVPGLILAGGSSSASPNASDALSGIDTSSCSPLDTSSAGTRTATCTATDKAGNTASATVGYTVTSAQFQWQQPLLPVIYSVNANQRVLLQWRLVNTKGGWVNTLPGATVTSESITCPASFAIALPPYTGAAIELQNIGDGMYRKTWQVAAAQAGSCLRMNLDVGDGKPHTVLFKLK